MFASNHLEWSLDHTEVSIGSTAFQMKKCLCEKVYCNTWDTTELLALVCEMNSYSYFHSLGKLFMKSGFVLVILDRRWNTAGVTVLKSEDIIVGHDV